MYEGKPNIEFTIGVAVAMKWDVAAGRYVLDGQPFTTDAGLFSDACEGPWVPEREAWEHTDSDDDLIHAHNMAEEVVAQAFFKG